MESGKNAIKARYKVGDPFIEKDYDCWAVLIKINDEQNLYTFKEFLNDGEMIEYSFRGGTIEKYYTKMEVKK